MTDLPTVPGGYRTVLADPPWAFQSYAGPRVPSHGGAAGSPYKVLSTSELAEIPVDQIVAADAALFMWVSDSAVADALVLGSVWGFTFKTVAFTWVKSRLGGYPVIGMGYWTRKQTEQCWLFTRGKPKRLSKGVEQLLHCPRGAHSAKPDQQYDRIEALVAGPYLEMFSRSVRQSWDSWGDEVGARDGHLFSHADVR